MSRTDIDAATLANYLRQMCGDGSVEWCYEPMQTSVLLDMADMLDEDAKLQDENARLRSCLSDDADNARAIIGENVKLRELCKELLDLCYDAYEQKWGWDDDWALAYEQAKKLGVEVHE